MTPAPSLKERVKMALAAVRHYFSMVADNDPDLVQRHRYHQCGPQCGPRFSPDGWTPCHEERER